MCPDSVEAARLCQQSVRSLHLITAQVPLLYEKSLRVRASPDESLRAVCRLSTASPRARYNLLFMMTGWV